jgi:PAS domain S-box-containing protein
MLRQTTQNIEDLSYNVLTYLVNYTGSNQGAIFLAEDSSSEKPIFEMAAAYAYERKKHMTKTIALGEGLIGTCAIEKETIFMDDIPDNYIRITSGLGKANPKSLIIVPLKVKDIIYGVLELASFNRYNKFEIDFLENAAESIASTFSISKINIVTSQLLEQSQQQQEEMRAQEEEMRQNMEELQTTQEESARRELEMNGILDALDSSYIVLELNLDGSIISINENAKNLLGNSSNAVEGQNIRTLLKQDEIDEFEVMWNTILEGESTSRQRKIKRGGKEFIISESYTPVYNEMDEIYKILNIGVEIVEK